MEAKESDAFRRLCNSYVSQDEITISKKSIFRDFCNDAIRRGVEVIVNRLNTDQPQDFLDFIENCLDQLGGDNPNDRKIVFRLARVFTDSIRVKAGIRYTLKESTDKDYMDRAIADLIIRKPPES